MEKIIINVPKGIRFMNDWNGFSIPNHPHILNKGLTGCGFTHYSITNSENVILCSPRKMLLENKKNQHPNVHLVVNDYDRSLEVDKDLTNLEKKRPTTSTPLEPMTKEYHINMKQEITNHVYSCQSRNIPCKILVTYDSFRIVKEALGDIKSLNQFRVVVDEFQSIFTDARFKSETEMEFLYHLSNIDKVCFVSATPMMDEYLDKLDSFNKLPYYILDWSSEDPNRIIRPQLKVRTMRGNSLITIANGIIDDYKQGNYEKSITKDDQGNQIEVESKEVIFYVNSVKNITDIIRKADLEPKDVNILCANTPDNLKKIQKSIGKVFTIGTIPVINEKRKIYTFCTRTVYLGADFYSDNARTIILSDANIECLAVDITLDLPQIMGRQRLDINPWKNRAEIFIKLYKDVKIPKEQFEALVENKVKSSKNLLKSYSLEGNDKDMRLDLAGKYLRDAKNSNYNYDYVAVNTHIGGTLTPVFNNLVMIAEQRAFDIQQVDYADRFSIFSSINLGGYDIDTAVSDFVFQFHEFTRFPERMKYLCTESIKFSETDLEFIFKQIPTEYSKYYKLLGPKVIKACGYEMFQVERRLLNNKLIGSDELADLIYQKFKEGERLSVSRIKGELADIYQRVNLKNLAKATDILEYFEIKKIKITELQEDGIKKSVAAFKLIKKLK